MLRRTCSRVLRKRFSHSDALPPVMSVDHPQNRCTLQCPGCVRRWPFDRVSRGARRRTFARAAGQRHGRAAASSGPQARQLPLLPRGVASQPSAKQAHRVPSTSARMQSAHASVCTWLRVCRHFGLGVPYLTNEPLLMFGVDAQSDLPSARHDVNGCVLRLPLRPAHAGRRASRREA